MEEISFLLECTNYFCVCVSVCMSNLVASGAIATTSVPLQSESFAWWGRSLFKSLTVHITFCSPFFVSWCIRSRGSFMTELHILSCVWNAEALPSGNCWTDSNEPAQLGSQWVCVYTWASAILETTYYVRVLTWKGAPQIFASISGHSLSNHSLSSIYRCFRGRILSSKIGMSALWLGTWRNEASNLWRGHPLYWK